MAGPSNPFADLVPATPQEVSQVNPFADLGQNSKVREEQEKEDRYATRAEFLKDFGRTLLQGVSLGNSDEVIAAVRSKFEGRPASELRQEERDALKRFHRAYGPGATAAEIGAGVATPMGPLAKAAQASTFIGKVAKSIPVGYVTGAISGYGASESSDVGEQAAAAHEGGKMGALVAPAVPVALKVGGSLLTKGDAVAQNIANTEKAAQLYLADKLRSRGLTEAQLATDLQRGQAATQFSGGAAHLPETIADVTPTTQRVLRGIKVGGDADEIIEPFLAKRQAGTLDFTKGAEAGGQFDRLAEDLRLSMKLGQKDLQDKLVEVTGKRSKEADALFGKARAQSEPFDLSRTLEAHSLNAMDMPDPAQREVMRRAISMFDQSGTAGAARPNTFAVDNVKRFHEAKQALDDLINRSEVKEQGNLRRTLLQLKHDLMGDVFGSVNGKPTRNVAYREALDKFASRSELLNAADLGRGFASGAEPVTDAMFRAMSEGEKAMFRLSYVDAKMRGLGGKAAGPTTDFTQPFRSPNTGKELRRIMPPTAGKSSEFPGGNREKLTELINREHRMSGTATKVLGNSSTAEKAVDAIDIGRMARALRYIKNNDGLIPAAAASLSEMLEKMSAIKGPRAQYLARHLLSTDPVQQQAFLNKVAQTYGKNSARRINEALNAWMTNFESSLSGFVARTEQGKKN